jgi:hypothetical protein
MPYTRLVRRFYLTLPRLLTFIVSLILAIAAELAVYGHFAALHGVNGFIILMIARLVLAAAPSSAGYKRAVTPVKWEAAERALSVA